MHGSKRQDMRNGIPRFETLNGLFVPFHNGVLERNQASKIPLTPEYRSKYLSAVRDSVSNAIKNNYFKPTDIILDTSWYHTPKTEAWVRNVLSDTKALHAFFDMGIRGIESCASRFFATL